MAKSSTIAISPSVTARSSTFTALRNPVYRNLWLATLLSGTCVSAHDTAATWAMNMLSPSPFLLSLMSTVASLPFFFFTLPAGALADMLDRKKLMLVMNFWLAGTAALLAIVGLLGLLSPWIILVCVFLTGIGFAFNSPAWTAVVPDIVTDAELPSAATLGGLQLNISGIIGPAIGGILLRFFAPNWVFALNAACFFVVILAILRWKENVISCKLPLENFLESFTTAIRYVRYAPGIQVVMARNVLFAFFISIIPALLPVVGLKQLHLQPASLGLLFTCMGAGSVFGAVLVVPRARDRLSSNALIFLANLIVVIVYLGMALVRDPVIFMLVAAFAGVAWTLAASELWVAGQRAMPSWARGRMNAVVIMAAQGALALGGIVWGYGASTFGISQTILVAAGTLLLSLLLTIPLSINFISDLDFNPAAVGAYVHHRLTHVPRPHDGPVSITIEFEVDRKQGSDFIRAMREVRLIHLRNGAFSWRLHEDLERFNTFRLEMMVPSWNEHLLQQERLTKTEKATLDRAWSMHVGKSLPEERIYLCVNREVLNHRILETHPSTMPGSPLDLGKQEVEDAT
jgi:predicted MFS family arabinose efflux permease